MIVMSDDSQLWKYWILITVNDTFLHWLTRFRIGYHVFRTLTMLDYRTSLAGVKTGNYLANKRDSFLSYINNDNPQGNVRLPTVRKQ